MARFRVLNLFLFSFLALTVSKSVLGSGSDLPEDQVEEVLALYRKHCSPSSAYGPGPGPGTSTGGYGPPSSSGGWGPPPPKVSILCKEGRDDYHPPTKKVIKIPASKPQKNIVFVEAPALKVKHHINLVQTGGNPGRTVVYVLPQKATHALKVWDKRGGIIEQKPQVFFLKNDKVLGGSAPYGVPAPPGASYGQLGPEVTTFRPVVSYAPVSANLPIEGRFPASFPAPQAQFPAPLVAPFPVTAAGGFDPSRLGPEYEVVRADPDTQAAYQKLLDAGGDPNRFQYNVQSANALFDQQQQQQLQPQAYGDAISANANANVAVQSGGRLLFPSESIQSYQYSPGPGKGESSSGIKFPESGEDETIREEVRDLFRNYEREQEKAGESTTTQAPVSSSTAKVTSEVTTVQSQQTTQTPQAEAETEKPKEKATTSQPERLSTNIFDRSFVQSLIAKARNNETAAEPEVTMTTPSSFPRGRSQSQSQVVFRLFRSDPSFVYDAPISNQNRQSQNVRRFPSSLKRSVLRDSSNPAITSMSRSQGFEIFPAQFVSYSYSKLVRKK